MDSIIQSITDALNGLPKELVVLIISLFPILELRGGLIASALLGLPIERGILFALIGNIIPRPIPWEKANASGNTNSGAWCSSWASRCRAPAPGRAG